MAGGDGASYAGPEAGLGSLIQKAAEHVVEVTEPTRLAGHLANPGSTRVAEARAILERVADDPAQSREIRAIAVNALANISARLGDGRKALALVSQGARDRPHYPLGYINAVGGEQQFGHAEAALALIPMRYRCWNAVPPIGCPAPPPAFAISSSSPARSSRAITQRAFAWPGPARS